MLIFEIHEMFFLCTNLLSFSIKYNFYLNENVKKRSINDNKNNVR